ncbi:Flavodoxin [Spironucleus salmonicida]|uniref:Flavodoxin n=1 Tax=Spironucleus salmonicida TaxID=348837 RepID=V6LMI4_9EUKA|nr:Flavodoxin [Spironucleus salmonicida]|eukprot:EST45907.1 Flavodoxin [Spironucleus salmonicida]
MIQIIYSSQLGKTKSVANKLFKLLKGANINVSEPISSKNIKQEQMNQDFIYLTSTFFDGDHPSSARKGGLLFAQTDQLKDLVKHKKFAVFGIGSSSHKKYNQASINADKIFAQLGGQRMIDLVKFDRASKDNIEDVLNKWVESISEKFK